MKCHFGDPEGLDSEVTLDRKTWGHGSWLRILEGDIQPGDAQSRHTHNEDTVYALYKEYPVYLDSAAAGNYRISGTPYYVVLGWDSPVPRAPEHDSK